MKNNNLGGLGIALDALLSPYSESVTIVGTDINYKMNNGTIVTISKPQATQPKRAKNGRFIGKRTVTKAQKPNVTTKVPNKPQTKLRSGQLIYQFMYKGENDRLNRFRTVIVENETPVSIQGLDVNDNNQFKTFLKNRINSPIITKK